MPIPATADLPPPLLEDEFENMVTDVLRLYFRNESLVRFGGRGQFQAGIDGGDLTAPRAQSPVWQSTLQARDIEKKIASDLAALDADPKGQPRLFVVALGSKRDAKLQSHFQALSEARVRQIQCPILALFWDDIRDILSSDAPLLRKWYSSMFPADRPASSPDLLPADVLVLASLSEHREEHVDDLDPWTTAPSGIEIEIRTGLAPRTINDAEEILREKGLVESRPFGLGEKGGSTFKFYRMKLTALGQRAFDGAPGRSELPGPRLPLPEFVTLTFPQSFRNDGEPLLFAEQRRGFKVAWEDEWLLPSVLKNGFQLVTVPINGRTVRLSARHGSRFLALLRGPLREPTEDEALTLIKERVVDGLTYLRKEGEDWVVKNQTPVVSPFGGPPSSIMTSDLARRRTLLEVLADLRIPFLPHP